MFTTLPPLFVLTFFFRQDYKYSIGIAITTPLFKEMLEEGWEGKAADCLFY
jgi:hypothetical protein